VLAVRFPKSLADKFVKFLTYLNESLRPYGYTPPRELEFSVELDPKNDTQKAVVRAFEKLPNDGEKFGLGEYSAIKYGSQNVEHTRKHYEGEKLGYVRSKRWLNSQRLGLFIQPEKITWNDSVNYRTLIPYPLAEELAEFLNGYVEDIRQYNKTHNWGEWDSLKELKFFVVEE
jgi:hypothetical protein